MATTPSSIALYSDFAGASGSPYPSGWEAGLYSGESGWQLDGSGHMIPSGTGWKSVASSTGWTRAASGGVIYEYSGIPGTGGVLHSFLLTDKTADSIDGFGVRWAKGTDFQLQSYTGGSATYRDGCDESTITGSITAGFKIAIMADGTTVTAYCSTDGGSNWQEIGTYTDSGSYSGTMYAGVETDAGTGVQVDNVWLGLNGSGSVVPFGTGRLLFKDEFSYSDGELPTVGSADWANPWWGTQPPIHVVSGEVHSTGNVWQDAYTLDSFSRTDGIDFIARGFVAAAGNSISTFAHILGTPGTNPSGYFISVNNITGTGNDIIRFGKNVSGTATILIAVTQEWTDGDDLGCRIEAGGMCRLFYRPAAGEWTEIGTAVSDTAFSSGIAAVEVKEDISGYTAIEVHSLVTQEVVSGAIASVFTGTSVAPAIPTHVAGDLLLLVGSKNDAATLSASGWTAVGTPENNANLSTGAWYKIAASGAETATVSSSTSASATAGLYAQAFVADGTVYESIEDATWNGSPTSSTTPASSTITTTVDDSLALAIALIDSQNAFVSGLPPAGWELLDNESYKNPTPPTLTAGSAIVANTDSAAPYTLAVAMPAGHQADDILFVLAMKDNAANLTTATSGWAAVTGTQQNAAFSTCLFWKRATSSSEANMVLESSTSGQTIGIAAFPFFVRGCVTTGDPWEDLTMNGSPTSSTTPASAVIDTTGDDRLVLAVAAIGDNNAITNYPPADWSAGANFNSATGNDYTALIIQRNVPSAAQIAAVNIATQGASDYWRTFTFGLKPQVVGGSGRITSISKAQATAGDVTGATIGTLSGASYWKTLALALNPPIPPTSRLKRWDGSQWVVATVKHGTSWPEVVVDTL